jgi:hypothetical protein
MGSTTTDMVPETAREKILDRLDEYDDRLAREIAKPLIDRADLARLIEIGLQVQAMRARISGEAAPWVVQVALDRFDRTEENGGLGD